MAEVPETNFEDDALHNEGTENACSKCKVSFTSEKPAKLLPCLHTFCESCLSAKDNDAENNDGDINKDDAEKSEHEVTSPKKTKCPDCLEAYTAETLIENPFMQLKLSCLVPGPSSTEDGYPSEARFPVCTSCDENERATSFCVDCQEWLCDPCVVAHKRVRITKDHNVTKKPGETTESETLQRPIFCQTHKTEMLKLFCLTCEALTCRDCQLNEHKDHKYQFIEETIGEQKDLLKRDVDELKSRLKQNKDISDKIAEKEKDIKKQQVEVFEEVRHVADSVTHELINWCKQLLNFLQGVAHGRVKDLTYKKKEVDSYARKARYSIDFVEKALNSGDDLAFLYAKSFMSKKLKLLKEQTINVLPSLFDFSIKYENDHTSILKNVSKMGFINVNGKSYPHKENAESSKTQINLANVNKKNFQETIASILNQNPPEVRDRYMSLNEEQRKVFLQNLMTGHLRQSKQRQNVPPVAVAASRVSVPPPLRPGNFSSDSNAIQDLYAASRSTVRPSSTYVPTNPALNYQQQIRAQQLQQQQLRQQQQQTIGNLQNWRGSAASTGSNSPSQTSWTSNVMAASQSLQNLMHISQGFGTDKSNQSKGHAAAASAAVHAAQQAQQPLIPKNMLPPGRFDIDPLNLRGSNSSSSSSSVRVKQEPKERDFGESCKFDKNKPTAAPQPTVPFNNGVHGSSQQITSPPGAVNQSLTRASPGHTPSPSRHDGGHTLPDHHPSISPAVPDINVMDSDRNELLKGLTHPSGLPMNTYHLHPKHDPSDPSEDYCGVCHNGGDLLCCDRCPKVFHLNCHVPTITTLVSSSEQWSCTMCIPDEELIITTPIVHEFEITSNGKRKAPSGLLDKEIKVCERILLELFCHQLSTVFHEPVPKSVPNYHKVIQQPIDFSTIKTKLRRGHFAHYNRIDDFLSDVKLVFRNCFKFNLATTDVHQVGKQVECFFQSLVQHFLPCYIPNLHRRTPTPEMIVTDTNGAGEGPSRNKKRRSPAPDSILDGESAMNLY